ncbi:MAG: hypothetical protein GPJ54_09670 [Candidatus Heimdallarchaeota archaeon]|nr:hypothetical protein [Candidatus Heimdallarchaeota archaeon]
MNKQINNNSSLDLLAMDLIRHITTIGEELEKLDTKRDKLIRTSRTLNRMSGQGITLIIQGRKPEHLLDKLTDLVDEINSYMSDLLPLVTWNTVGSDLEEYSEFIVLYNIIYNDKFVLPNEINVPPWIWLTSIADVIGEIRRIILRHLIDQDFKSAKKYYNILSELSSALRGQIFSKSLIPNLRRKIDIVRALTEKTESDIANASLKYTEIMNKSEGN